MQLEERSYAGRFFRPKPQILKSENPDTVMIVTSWGEKDESDRVVQIFKDQLRLDTPSDQAEPYGLIESLSSKANQLRVAALMANDVLFNEANKSEFVCALEFLGLVYDGGILSWVQIGAPQVVLKIRDQIQPLVSQVDMSWQYQQESPLLSQALGLQSTCQLNCGSLHVPDEAELFLISRHALSPQIFTQPALTLSIMTDILVKDSNQAPFWSGHLQLN